MNIISCRISASAARYAIFLSIAIFIGISMTISVNAQNKRKTPYWASIDESKARMRTGPSTEYPVKWVYRREKLPIKVIDIHQDWRKIEDPDGDQGWMHVRLLSPVRTAMVIGKSNAELLDEPSPNSRVAWRAEPGVVGRIEDCKDGYCRMDIAGRAGYIDVRKIMGEEKI